MVTHAVGPSPHPKSVDLPVDTKERLIQVAKHLFANKGFDGCTVKEISDGAGLNVSLISYHFHGKEGLYRSCLESFGKKRLEAAQRILHSPTSVEEFRIRLTLFVEEFFSTQLEEPEISRILMRECDLGLPIVQDIFKDTFWKTYETLVGYFKEAQNQSLVRKDLQPEIFVGILFGGLLHITQRGQMIETMMGHSLRDPKYRQTIIQNAISFCLHGCLNAVADRSSSL